ncbi:MAG: YkgJ family cysteine cluster protein [Desulfobacteraceae bacterium]|nr:MAG: YkgJ family cysteine cluster protein [Desulfobacteraceae bacterium]
MDDTWKNVADQYGFVCNGCEDNCCQTLFFHHTHIERDYLVEGFNALEKSVKLEVLHKAEAYCDKLLLFSSPDKPFRMMCPLNLEGRCLIYDHRPMICRLHGLPHELSDTNGDREHQPGCRAGHARFNTKGYIPFNRTKIYTQMASLEAAYTRTIRRQGQRIKLTIAQMLTQDT